MSIQKLEKTKNMASQLTPAEQAELIVWLGNSLQRNLPVSQPDVQLKRTHRKKSINVSAKELQVVSTPKSGAEIAAMLESGVIDTQAWNEIDIPDSVAWLKELRHSEQIHRGTQQ